MAYISNFLIHHKCGRPWEDHVHQKLENETTCLCPLASVMLDDWKLESFTDDSKDAVMVRVSINNEQN